ncbi:MAG TPA: hypothetical protein VFS67_30365 [Polyangiaceae bacterium]|nr:hypothetical protein [Polyangiaceae bacterium]
MLRGYILKQSVSFIESDYFSPQTRRAIFDGLPPEVSSALPVIKPAEWYSRDYLMEMLRGIARVKNTDAGAYEDLVAYGTYVSTEATNTFLKLLLKMLTPTLFAKKIPEVWQRDHRNSGAFEVDVQHANEGLIKLRLVGAGGFDHVGITSIGFISNALKTMGKSDVRMTQTGWSLATPGPDRIDYELRWK